MAKPKFDYDSDDFYDEILALAMQGFNDAEIADALGDKFGNSLDPETFNTMKNGSYIGWNKEQNERRGSRILKVLARGRRKVTGIVRGRYLKAALGGIKTKNIQRVKKPIYDDQGNLADEVVVQISESEFESSPNIQALATWLYNHDPDWRKIQRGMDVEAQDIPTNIEQGVDIDKWIKKETELQSPDTEEQS